MKRGMACFLCLTLLFFTACGSSQNVPVMDPSVDGKIPDESPENMNPFPTAVAESAESLTTTDIVYLFEMDLKRAYTLLLGTYIGSRQCTAEQNSTPYSYTEFGFSVEQVYMGSFEEKEIWMRIADSAVKAAGDLRTGQRYFFPLNYEAYIFMPEMQYSANFLIPVQQDGSMEPYRMEKMKTELSFHQLDELLDFCSKTLDLTKNGPIQGWQYTLSEDIQVIMQNAPCVFIGSFSELETEINRSYYMHFTVNKTLRGKIPQNAFVQRNQDGCLMVFIRNRYEVKHVKLGELYVFAGSFSSEDNAICMPYATKNAVIPFDDTDCVQQVYDALGIQPEP